jgi:hypothetical protein
MCVMPALIRGLALGAGACAVALIATVGVFLAVERPAAGAAPQYGVARIGGVEYQAMNGRALNAASPVDRPMLAGGRARFYHLRHGEMLYGAFIAVTNTSTRPVRSASRIDLRVDDGPTYHALPLRRTSPYAYSARVIRPGTRIPAFGSPADTNLAATGRLVLFRIPTAPYTNGAAFALVIHAGSQTAQLPI